MQLQPQVEDIENRTSGHKPAARSLVSCTACSREIPRDAVTCHYCGNPGPGARTIRTSRKRRNITKCILGGLMMLAGALSIFYLQFPINVIAGPTALILGAATDSVWQCGRCEAEVGRVAGDWRRCALPFSL